MNKKNDLKSSVQWINGLEEKRRMQVLRLIGSDAIFRLEKIEVDYIRVFINFIIKEFENGIDDNDIVSKLLKAGVEKETAKKLIIFSEHISLQIQSCKTIMGIGLENYEKLLLFVVNKIHLYREINYIPFEEFIDEFGFKNEVEAKSALKFVNTYLYKIIEREMTIENVKCMFIRVHELDSEYANLFEDIIRENLEELRSAYIIFKLNKIQDFIDSFEDVLDDEEDDNFEEEISDKEE